MTGCDTTRSGMLLVRGMKPATSIIISAISVAAIAAIAYVAGKAIEHNYEFEFHGSSVGLCAVILFIGIASRMIIRAYTSDARWWFKSSPSKNKTTTNEPV